MDMNCERDFNRCLDYFGFSEDFPVLPLDCINDFIDCVIYNTPIYNPPPPDGEPDGGPNESHPYRLPAYDPFRKEKIAELTKGEFFDDTKAFAVKYLVHKKENPKATKMNSDLAKEFDALKSKIHERLNQVKHSRNILKNIL